MKLPQSVFCAVALLVSMPFLGTVVPAQAQAPKPNIVVIMGDDIGWFNVGAYHQGIMAGRTPNLDRLATEGMRSLENCRSAPA